MWCSKIWSSLLSNKEKSGNIETGQDTSYGVQQLRDALIKSKQPQRSIGDGDILPEVNYTTMSLCFPS